MYDDWCDAALIGICAVSDFFPVALYSKSKILELMAARGLSEDEQREYYSNKFLSVRAGELTPVILCDVE